MSKSRRKRRSYTAQQRQTILAAAKKVGLTAAHVQKKFGMTPVTYYSWRKKTGMAARRGRGAAGRNSIGGTDLTAHVRSEVQTKIRQILPGIVRSEVSQYLDTVFGARRGRRV